MLTSLDHVIVCVRDLEAATDAYERLLGRAVSWRGEHPHFGTANSLFRLENTYLELLSPRVNEAWGAQLVRQLDERGEGVIGMAFGTDDAKQCADWLRDRGVPAADPADGEGREATRDVVRRWANVMIPPETTRGPLVFAIEHQSPPDALPLVAPEEPAAALVALDHVVIQTRDPDATAAFYGDGLGLRLALDRSFEQFGARMQFFRVGGITVEVVSRLDQPVEPQASDQPGGLAWVGRDLDRARARISGAGFDVSEVREGRKPGTRVATVREGTCGVPTLLIEHPL